MKVIKLIFWLAICQLPAGAGAYFVRGNMGWYDSLVAPPLTPPDALFGIVWAILYFLLGIAAFLALFDFPQAKTRTAAWLFFIQLALNSCWTPVFFGQQNLAGALFLILVMLVEGFWLFNAFWRKSRWAGVLLVPYMGWLAFATYLTAGFWFLN